VKKYNKFAPHSHQLSLPLFDWREAVTQQVPITRAGLHLTRKHRIHPSIADTIASLAGVGEMR
jgi:hypothetical protein